MSGVSDQTIRLVLGQLRKEGKVPAEGTGRFATWTRMARAIPWRAPSCPPCATGAVDPDERMTRVRKERPRLVSEGPSRTRSRELDFETVTLPERDCDLLRDLLTLRSAGLDSIATLMLPVIDRASAACHRGSHC